MPNDSAHQLMQNMTKDNQCLDIIDYLKFNIGVQAFSNLNRVVTFHIDMRNPKSQQMKPDKLVLDEIKYFIEAQKKE